MKGRTIGDFLLEEELGRGGMGVVYRATQLSLGRRVAVKVLAPAIASDRRALARLRREAEAVAKLDHPGIVRVIAVSTEAEEPAWIAMELIEGEPLSARIERGRGAGAQTALRPRR